MIYETPLDETHDTIHTLDTNDDTTDITDVYRQVRELLILMLNHLLTRGLPRDQEIDQTRLIINHVVRAYQDEIANCEITFGDACELDENNFNIYTGRHTYWRMAYGNPVIGDKITIGHDSYVVDSCGLLTFGVELDV